MDFTEYDDMILLESAESAEANVRDFKERGLWKSRWRFERGANHTHADMGVPDREHVRQELEIAAGFVSALRNAYPERRFVISHIPNYAVSFYSVTGDAPATAGNYSLPSHPFQVPIQEGMAWCQNCQRSRPYIALPSPDPEFPFVEWGRCIQCGSDVIINPDVEILTPIGPP